MIHGMIFSGHFGLGFKRPDVSDDIADGFFVGKAARHWPHQTALAIMGIRAAHAAPEFPQLGRQIPIIHACNAGRSEVLISSTVISMAGTASRIKRLSRFRIAGK